MAEVLSLEWHPAGKNSLTDRLTLSVKQLLKCFCQTGLCGREVGVPEKRCTILVVTTLELLQT